MYRLMILLVLLVSCEVYYPGGISTPKPVVSNAPVDTKPIKEDERDILCDSGAIICPPKSERELPRVKIISDPQNVLTLSVMKVPKTVRFEAQVLNEKNTGGISSYWWKIEKLGIPFVSNDMIINQQEGKAI